MKSTIMNEDGTIVSSIKGTCNWFDEVINAYEKVKREHPLTKKEDQFIACRNNQYDNFFEKLPDGLYTPIEFNNLTGDQLENYKKLIEFNCLGVELEQKIYHITLLSYFLEAQRYGGFVLGRPKDWSINWEDSAFKNLLGKFGSECDSYGVSVERFVKCYQDNTYGMCWSSDKWNRAVVDKLTKNNNYDPLVMIESTVYKLLAAYYKDRSSFARCFIRKVDYNNKETQKTIVPDFIDLQNADIGTAVHLSSTSETIEQYKNQNEVRLIFIDVPEDKNKTILKKEGILDPKKPDKQGEKVMMIKQMNIRDVITNVEIRPICPITSIQRLGYVVQTNRR